MTDLELEQFAVNFTIIIATRNRAEDIRRLLTSLTRQTYPPAEVILVDSSDHPIKDMVLEFPQLNLKYIRHWPPSASSQRNAGIEHSDSANSFVGFVDDDTAFDPNAFEAMKLFWETTDHRVMGAAFNLCNYPARKGNALKRNWLTARLGLYDPRPGYVAKSGWQSVIPRTEQTHQAEWVPTTAVIYRREALASSRFDEFYDSYSYLEDLDLSYTIGKRGMLVVVAEARYCHYPSSDGRIGMREFGFNEVRNRVYFVRKHGLSVFRCYVGLLIRMGITILSFLRTRNVADLDRLSGNVSGIALQVAIKSTAARTKITSLG